MASHAAKRTEHFETLIVDGDTACRFQFSDQYDKDVMAYRVHGDHTLVVSCVGLLGPRVDACRKVLGGLRFPN
jgi:hypothetical protein